MFLAFRAWIGTLFVFKMLKNVVGNLFTFLCIFALFKCLLNVFAVLLSPRIYFLLDCNTNLFLVFFPKTYKSARFSLSLTASLFLCGFLVFNRAFKPPCFLLLSVPRLFLYVISFCLETFRY